MPRRLGQHLLRNQAILRRIAEAAVPADPERVIEIGPGEGSLTEHLARRASHTTAIEIDPAMVAILARRLRSIADVEIIHADILKTDLEPWTPAVVAGNLPYYITSPILEKVLALGAGLVRAVFLVQKEVADRLTAGPGTRDYGYLTVQTQLKALPRRLFRVPPSAFKPPPKVDSAVVLLDPHPEPLTPDPDAFLLFASACFRQKRKTLRNNLQGEYPGIGKRPEAGRRAEELSLEELVGLHRELSGPPESRRHLE